MAASMKRIFVKNRSNINNTGVNDTIGTVPASKVWILHELTFAIHTDGAAANAKWAVYVLPSGGTDFSLNANHLGSEMRTTSATGVPLMEAIENDGNDKSLSSEFTRVPTTSFANISQGFHVKARGTVLTAGDALKMKRYTGNVIDVGYNMVVSYEEIDA